MIRAENDEMIMALASASSSILIPIPFRPQRHGLDVELRFLRSIINANQHFAFLEATGIR